MRWFWIFVLIVVLSIFIYGSIWYAAQKLKPGGIFGVLYGIGVVVLAFVIIFTGAGLAAPVFEDTQGLWKKIITKECKCVNRFKFEKK